MSEDLLRRDEDGVLVLTLNRPDSLNSLSLPMNEALQAALRDAEVDETVGCVVLTGAGERAFGRFMTAPTAPSVSAKAMIAPPCMVPPTVERPGCISIVATTRSGVTSTNVMPMVSAKVPLKRSAMLAASNMSVS